jgi:hypothetical protein
MSDELCENLVYCPVITKKIIIIMQLIKFKVCPPNWLWAKIYTHIYIYIHVYGIIVWLWTIHPIIFSGVLCYMNFPKQNKKYIKKITN